jgi:hypothetical protein
MMKQAELRAGLKRFGLWDKAVSWRERRKGMLMEEGHTLVEAARIAWQEMRRDWEEKLREREYAAKLVDLALAGRLGDELVGDDQARMIDRKARLRAYRGLLGKVCATESSPYEISRWVMDNHSKPATELKAEDVPGPAALELLMWVWESDENRQAFFVKMWPTMASQRKAGVDSDKGSTGNGGSTSQEAHNELVRIGGEAFAVGSEGEEAESGVAAGSD